MKRYIILITILFLLTFLLSCTGKPSQKEIKKAISEYGMNPDLLYSSRSISINDAFKKISSLNFEVIEIQEIGRFNKEKKYLPIRARIKGSYEVDHGWLGGIIKREFDWIIDYRIYQDDYGNWKAMVSLFD